MGLNGFNLQVNKNKISWKPFGSCLLKAQSNWVGLAVLFSSQIQPRPQVIYNSYYNNGVLAMFTSQFYLKLKGKHCRKSHCHDWVVDHFGHKVAPAPTIFFTFIFPGKLLRFLPSHFRHLFSELQSLCFAHRFFCKEFGNQQDSKAVFYSDGSGCN